jgi:hypothetical protein
MENNRSFDSVRTGQQHGAFPVFQSIIIVSVQPFSYPGSSNLALLLFKVSREVTLYNNVSSCYHISTSAVHIHDFRSEIV